MTMKSSLLENFYTETSSTFSKENFNNFICEIRLNPQHSIYNGHFEKFPVVPGVCLTQIIQEILAGKLQRTLILTHGDNIKFLAMINPNETPELSLSFSIKDSGASIEANATYSARGVSYTKFKGKFAVLE
jgi:3-hydroxyacyl-[acyl-carrier-protein] dehydratase